MASQWNSTFWPLLVADFTALATKLLEGWAPLPYLHRLLTLLTLTNKRGLKEDLANRRPITLLCVDYKLLAKALATCLCVVLPTCSILSRMIFENLYLSNAQVGTEADQPGDLRLPLGRVAARDDQAVKYLSSMLFIFYLLQRLIPNKSKTDIIENIMNLKGCTVMRCQ